MPAKKHKTDRINLLPQEEFAASTLGRILSWLLSTFRTIVIVSEMIVMGAFLSRFWLDAQNSDLTDSIKQRQAVVAQYASFEKTFRSTQKKLTIFNSLTNTQREYIQPVDMATSILPNNVYINAYTLSTDDMLIKGSSATEESIAIYLASLKNSKFFKDVTLDQISVDEKTSLITFTIRAVLNPIKGGTSGS